MLPFCFPELSLFVKRLSQSAKAQDNQKKNSGFQNPSTEKTVQALWRCCNGLVMDFKEAETKDRQQ